MLARSRCAPARGLVCLALICAATSPALALGPYVWPDDGAPICNAPGDQHQLFYSNAGCNALVFNWLQSTGGADTVEVGSVGPIPPGGECARPSYASLEATGATELSAVEVRTPVLGIPGCFGPGPTAELLMQGAGAASELVVHDAMWQFGGHQRVVADDGDFVRHHPRMAPSGNPFVDTALVVVWSDERTGVAQIRAQRVDWSGVREWGGSGVLIAPTGSPQSDPEVSRLWDGSTLVVWVDARSGGSDVYALRLLPDGSVAPGWPAGGLALEGRPELSGSPLIVGGTVYTGPSFVAWEESGPRFGGGRSIVARRLRDDGTPDPAWDLQGAVLSSSPTVEHLQDARLAGSFFSPALVVIWTDTRAATGANPTDLYAQWLDGSGSPRAGWPASGLAICTAAGRQDRAHVSVGGDAYAAFAWEDRRGADADVYAELRYADGTLPLGLWVPNGLAATSAAGDQTAPVVGVGNGGGCFVAWEDGRDLATSGLDLYAQAFTSEGDKLDVWQLPPPPSLSLGPPRPNPMRSETSFLLQAPHAGTLSVDVLDVAGRRVRTLVGAEYILGRRELTFDGRDDAGRELPPGMYSVRARVSGEVSTRVIIRIH
jgi:hypothetical protein